MSIDSCPPRATVRASASSRSIVAALTVDSCRRNPSSIRSRPCRSSAGTSTGNNGFSRFEQIRSAASHTTVSAAANLAP